MFQHIWHINKLLIMYSLQAVYHNQACTITKEKDITQKSTELYLKQFGGRLLSDVDVCRFLLSGVEWP